LQSWQQSSLLDFPDNRENTGKFCIFLACLSELKKNIPYKQRGLAQFKLKFPKKLTGNFFQVSEKLF